PLSLSGGLAMRWLTSRFLSLVAMWMLFSAALNATVTRVDITSRADIADGKTFGAAGAYERLIGRVYFTVNPDNAHNQQIVDLRDAPRGAQGVEFSADFYILKPKDMAKGNGAVLFEVSNRGGKGILRLVNGGSPAQEFGDEFLMRHGYTVAWVGW